MGILARRFSPRTSWSPTMTGPRRGHRRRRGRPALGGRAARCCRSGRDRVPDRVRAARGGPRRHRPRFTMPIFSGAPGRRCPLPGHGDVIVATAPDEPCTLTGVKLGDEQFAMAAEWEASGKLAVLASEPAPQRRDGAVLFAVAEERPQAQTLADPRRTPARDHRLDREDYHRRRRQDRLARLTPIEFETLLQTARGLTGPYPNESTKPGADPP